MKNLLVILGATAVGKTKLAVQLAKLCDGEIISADSRQVFRGMDLGTGKDLSEYQIGQRQVPYHLIDLLDAGESYHVNLFKEDFYNVFTQITTNRKLPILCGGTGMYIHSILQNQTFTAIPPNPTLRYQLITENHQSLVNRLNQYPAQLIEKFDTSTHKRCVRALEIAEYLKSQPLEEKNYPSIKPLIIGLYTDVETRRKQILQRLETRLDGGLIDEVEGLLKRGVSSEKLTFYGLEYKYVVAYLQNQLNLQQLHEQLGIAICQFAKRQMTFFRKMEKDGAQIHWISMETDFEHTLNKALQLIHPYFPQK